MRAGRWAAVLSVSLLASAGGDETEESRFLGALRAGEGPWFPRFAGILKDQAAGDAVLEALGGSASFEALFAAVHLGSPGASPAIEQALAADDPKRRLLAARGLARTGGEEAGKRLAELLEDSDPRVRAAALDGLAAQAPAPLKEPGLGASIEARLGDPDPMVRGAALRLVGDCGYPRGAVAGPLLSMLRDDPSGPARAAAARAVARLPASEEIAAALRAALDDGHPQVRRAAALALGSHAGPGDLERLAELGARDTNPLVRAAAAHGLARVGGTGASTHLVALLRSGEREVRIAACRGLALLRFGTASAELRRALEDADPSVRAAAADALGALRARGAVPGLIRALEDRCWQVREAAARALGATPSPEALPHLSAALLSPENLAHEHVRARSAWALGRVLPVTVGYERACREARQALATIAEQDPEEGVRRSAALALALAPRAGR